MRKLLTLSLLAIQFALPVAANAEDAQSILDQVRDTQIERWEGVTTYVVTKSIAGNRVDTYYERTEIQDDAGNSYPVFLPVSTLTGPGRQGAVPTMTPEQLEAFAQSNEMVGDAASTEMENGLEKNGLPRGLLAASGSEAEPWVSPDPRTMMGGTATFYRGAAESQRQGGPDYAGDAQETADHIADFAKAAQLIGTENIDGREAYHLMASDVNQVQDMDGEEFTLQNVSVWIDTDKYVMLQTKMEGVITSDNQSRPVTIERYSSDYRDVPDSKMYESYRQEMRIGGMMNEEQLAEMREAEKEMANFEQEMATMSDSERAMMERMMGPRLEMMRSMVAGEGFRTEVLIHEIRVNPDMAFQSTSTVGAPTAILASTSSADTLTGKVQQDLTTLGYEPGEITGEPTTATAIAISKFQAERGMTVTGEASPQLAGILSAEVDKQRSGGVTSANAPATTPTQDPATLRAAQQACLQEKMAAAQKAQKKKRGLGRLMRAVTRTAVQQGNYDIATTTNDVYSASATADDLAAAAEDLGLTEDDVEACKNP